MMNLVTRPVFVSETGPASRPELVVDDFWMVPPDPPQVCDVDFYVRVRNRDTQRPSPPGCVTWVRLSRNDSVIDSMYTAVAFGPGQSQVLTHRWNTGRLYGPALWEADVNPGMLYVEKEGTDDNQAYLRSGGPYRLDGGQSAGLNLPEVLSLSQPSPTPARTRLSIRYALPRQTRVSLKLYDITGKLVTTFAGGDQKPGYYDVVWNRRDARGRSVPAGVYICTLSAGDQRFSRRVVLTE